MDGTTARTDAPDVTNFDHDLDRAAAREGFLTKDVTQNDLSTVELKQLEGRLAYYEREALFERNVRIRIEYKAEAERTRIEIRRRKLYARAEAERVFEL